VDLVHKTLFSHPEVGACGGLGTPAFENGNVPKWLWQFQPSYALGPQGPCEGYVPSSRGYLHGASLSLRRSAWLELVSAGFKSILSDRKGADLSSGGDVEICYALQLAGWKLWYEPKLTFHHFIPMARLDWAYLIRVARGCGRSQPFLHIYEQQLYATNCTFRGIHVWPPIAQLISRSWLYQVQSVARRLKRLRVQPANNASIEQEKEVQRTVAEAHLETLLRNPVSYVAASARVRRTSRRFRETP